MECYSEVRGGEEEGAKVCSHTAQLVRLMAYRLQVISHLDLSHANARKVNTLVVPSGYNTPLQLPRGVAGTECTVLNVEWV